MKNDTFNPSRPLSLGIELEWQLLDKNSGALVNRNVEAIAHIKQQAITYTQQIKPEIVQNTIEINSSIHYNAEELLAELTILRNKLSRILDELGLTLSGGGAHPYAKMIDNKIYPTKRYSQLHQHYGYLIECFAVFSEQIHIGCSSGDEAIYLIHALGHYIPHLIAISAASPFYFGVDTHFNSSRLSMADTMPTSGVMPYFTNWQRFQEFLDQMIDVQLISNIKDLYWDIRPQAKFGTIEIRVCDSPLTIIKAAAIAAFTQSLCAYILDTRPHISQDLYLTYRLNRFSALRYGLAAKIVNLAESTSCILREDLLQIIERIKPYAEKQGNLRLLNTIEQECLQDVNDAKQLKNIYTQHHDFQRLVKYAIDCWHAS